MSRKQKKIQLGLLEKKRRNGIWKGAFIIWDDNKAIHLILIKMPLRDWPCFWINIWYSSVPIFKQNIYYIKP